MVTQDYAAGGIFSGYNQVTPGDPEVAQGEAQVDHLKGLVQGFSFGYINKNTVLCKKGVEGYKSVGG
jgi:hypothetical protein